MIGFVTLGLEVFPFERLVTAVDTAVGRGVLDETTLVQRGHTELEPEACRSVDFLDQADMDAEIDAADVIVGHAGVGTFLLARHRGRVPILFPRRGSLGEHVDDHQVPFAEEVGECGLALVAWDEDELIAMLEDLEARVAALSPTGAWAGKDLQASLRGRILRLAGVA